MQSRPIKIVVAEWVKIPAVGLAPLLERKIHERLVFNNPEYELRHSRGEWLGSIPPQINCIRKGGRYLLLPRGFLEQLLDLFRRFKQPYQLVDHRRLLPVVGIEFHGQLKDYQQEAAEAVLEKDFATLLGGPKSGKTVVALYVIAQRRQPTLIIIPTLALLDGWVRKIVNFLQIPAEEIGIVSNGTLRRGKVVTLAHTGEVAKQWRQLREHVGAIIVDECQRCPARVIAQLLPNFDARYVLGLASSNQRRDGLSRFIYYYLGDIAYTIHEKDAKEGRGIIPAAVVARLTEFQYPYTSRADYHPMLIALMSDAERSRRIADDIQRELREAPQMALVLSGGDEHNRLLMELLKERGIDVMVYGHSLGQTSDMDGGADPSVLPRLPAPDQPLAILMTPQVLMRTFRNLSARLLFLALPVYFRGRLAHAIRSLHVCDNGDCTGPPLKIYDYVDQRVPLLDNYFRMRSYNYGTHPESILRSH